ncbi:hypothetical protein [Myxococcus sp. CA040A]|uniref:hypothetical protein n=1 Tax=Myxococcus sp. CA040A TaxID=2741738 RepID=UPI00157AA160|nr:hypothetical protein [Myxococcus sp. CA040A]NTX08364.1 hypothetical protein [Myxococcus sp. CA040A]
MSDAVSREKKSPTAVTYLRVPLLLVTAMLTMGSGMGNPGCGSGDDKDDDDIGPERCESGCAISGAYVFRFQDATPLSADCGLLGVSLPEGERVVVVQKGSEVDITATLGELQLTGSHYGSTTKHIVLRAIVQLQRREGPPTELLYLIEGQFTEGPESVDAPASFSGTFNANHVNTVAGDPECRVVRRFTATR